MRGLAKSGARSFGAAEGQALVPVVIALPVLLLAAALVLNTGRLLRQKLLLQSAVDAAALAALGAYDRRAEEPCRIRINENEARSLARRYLAFNMPGDGSRIRLLELAVGGDGSQATVTVTAEAEVALPFPASLNGGPVILRSTAWASRSEAGCAGEPAYPAARPSTLNP